MVDTLPGVAEVASRLHLTRALHAIDFVYTSVHLASFQIRLSIEELKTFTLLLTIPLLIPSPASSPPPSPAPSLLFHRVFGYTGGRFREWLVIDLNFSIVVPTLCTTDDFFNWIPTDEVLSATCTNVHGLLFPFSLPPLPASWQSLLAW